MFHIYASLYSTEVFFKGVPQLFVTFINVLLNVK